MTVTPIPDGQMSNRMMMNRKVYVVYKYPDMRAMEDPDFPKEYIEKFRNEEIRVPTDGSKSVKLGYLAAERFLSQMPQRPSVKLDTGKWVVIPKALKIVEIEEEKAEPTKASDGLMCSACDFYALDTAGLKRHVVVKHPEFAKDD